MINTAKQDINQPVIVRLDPSDNVAVALRSIDQGEPLPDLQVNAVEAIPAGHKVATRQVLPGQPIVKYGHAIGLATVRIEPGQHAHLHNMAMGRLEPAAILRRNMPLPATTVAPRMFDGFVRSDGRVGTRNYVLLIPTVNCSATVCRLIAEQFNRQGALDPYPHVDGVVALTHQTGCGMDSSGIGIRMLRRTMAGYATHPNVAGALLVGLGCETNQVDELFHEEDFTQSPSVVRVGIQAVGGTRRAVEEGIGHVRALLEHANTARRQPVPLEHLRVGLQCGGSDGYSGVSANPALGAAVDALVAHGGAAVLSETPEIYGAEHLLVSRAVSPEVADKLLSRIRWWEEHCARHQGEMNNNPTPGNHAGGLTTILEKSLGAVAKGGTTPLVDVLEYAEKITRQGLIFMDTPGFDPISITGQVAGGANLVCFTTGRGSAYGCIPAPSIKVSTNSALYLKQFDDIDVNAGVILEGLASVQDVGSLLLDEIVKVASGHPSKSEALGYGHAEFSPWVVGASM